MGHGDYGAQGRPSWELLWERLDSLVEYRVGWRAQLRYLDQTRGGAALLGAEGLVPNRRQRARWAGGGRPTAANQAAIDRAYRSLRRRNVVRFLLRRLNQPGVRVEVHPESQKPVQGPRRRDLQARQVRIRSWDILVQAWSIGDTNAFQQAWLSALEDIGSDWGAYEYSSSVGVIL
jgi:hypothetical protein